MKSYAQRVALVAWIARAGWIGVVTGSAATSKADAEATTMMNSYQDEQRAADTARGKDTAWKPACKEVGLIQVGDSKRPGALRNFCLDANGNVLACFAPAEGKNTAGIRVYSPSGQLLKTLRLDLKPTAIAWAKDGSIFAAGDGRVLKLNADGKVLASAAAPSANEAVTITKETEDMVKEMAAQTKQPFKEQLASMKTSLEQRRGEVTGLAVTDQDVFLAVPAPSEYTYRVYRFSSGLENPKLVVEKLRGCCGQMDIQAADGKLWIPHNARHAVESYDRDGKELSKFGTAGRVKASDFGGCCEPKNLRVLANGDILAAESGPPTCIKRFSAVGKFKEVVALVGDTKGDCVRVTVEVSPDGRRYYLLDTTRDAIRIFEGKS